MIQGQGCRHGAFLSIDDNPLTTSAKFRPQLCQLPNAAGRTKGLSGCQALDAAGRDLQVQAVADVGSFKYACAAGQDRS